MRPGTPGNVTNASAAAANSTPCDTAPATAAIEFATLYSPKSPTRVRTSDPNIRTVNFIPKPSVATSRALTSAFRSSPYVVTGTDVTVFRYSEASSSALRIAAFPKPSFDVSFSIWNRIAFASRYPTMPS